MAPAESLARLRKHALDRVTRGGVTVATACREAGISRGRSKSAMWKIVRYALDGAPVVGLGTFPTYAHLFFYRGRELDDGSGLLEGGGSTMRSIRLRTPGDAARPAVKRIVRKAFKLGKG